MRDFKKLQVWAKAHQLTLAIYRTTKTFPREEIYGLISQMRRASASIPANIAEGCGRAGAREFARFLTIAMGSASELEYHLLLAHDLAFVESKLYQELAANIIEIKQMLTSLVNKVRTES